MVGNRRLEAPPLREIPGSYPRRKEEPMLEPEGVLAITLLIALLVIDRLTR